MNSIKVKKTELLDVLRKNRDQHRQMFLEATEGYRAQAIKELDVMLEEAKAGQQIRRSLRLIEPQDQTRDYDRAIRMLEMAQDDIIELEERDFAQYVLDDWSWKRQLLIANSNYSSTATAMLAQS